MWLLNMMDNKVQSKTSVARILFFNILEFYNAQTTWCWLVIDIRLLLPVRVVLNSFFNFLTF